MGAKNKQKLLQRRHTSDQKVQEKCSASLIRNENQNNSEMSTHISNKIHMKKRKNKNCWENSSELEISRKRILIDYS